MRYATLPNVQLLNLANSYYEAAEISTNEEANALPIVNLRCHAIELFLKSLHLADTAKDGGNGVYVLKPSSGKHQGHHLTKSFDKALQDHRDELLSGMPCLCEELKCLEGVFQKSRYPHEYKDSLPLNKAESVSRFLHENIARLEPYSVPIEHI